MKAEDSFSVKNLQGQYPAGIILAAGASTRMGRTKQLLGTGGKTFVSRILHEALISELKRVILVLGHEAKEIKISLSDHLDHPKLHLVENQKYKQGLSTSIIAGLKVVEDEFDHVMFILADMPHIDKLLINNLLRCYLDSHLSMAAVCISGKRSHPVIFNRKWYGELHRLKGDKGARELFVKHPEDVCLFEAGESYNDMDIDTPEDYEEFKKSIIPPI